MMRLLRTWLPVIPVVMAVLVLITAIPDLGPCRATGGLLSHLILCEPVAVPVVVVGPVDMVRGAPVAFEGEPLSGVTFAALAVIVAVVGARRLREMER